jgi:hypothetical protein
MAGRVEVWISWERRKGGSMVLDVYLSWTTVARRSRSRGTGAADDGGTEEQEQGHERGGRHGVGAHGHGE